MEDTSPEIRAIQQKMWLELSVEERLRRLGDLYALAKTFAESRAPREFSAEEKRRFVFRELYGFSLPDNK
jgi:hypothetical protein